ncbi:hypothetical protein E1B28_013484 [Marasmius oreades]|uniref:Uncharacterized protein n=1 Tax=Marasmius oreades TaxID=181124 RepID=A0A9P7RPZ9_9AGAR|nr:uncharacterized protein E1B28_013484 [Marasmius oreades]KAG7087525.1 hypothetical protein E1B28_013484 [Marasmius oreades]
MISQTARNTFKRALAWSNVKVIYTRITLTKYTTAYFFLALIYCLALVVLQSVAYADTATARNAVSSVVGCISFDGLVVKTGNQLEWCDGLPNVHGTTCTILQSEGTAALEQVQIEGEKEVEKDHDEEAQPITNELGEVVGVDYKGVVLSIQCARSFHWLKDALRDSVREDITILVFHVWLFALALVTILNESLPHLVSGLAGHAIVTGWSAFRVGDSRKMRDMYYSLILNGTCASSGGAQVDILGTQWWHLRNIHAIPTVALNAASLALVAILSLKLYKVYARQSFQRVGASPQVHSIYKLVLVLSSFLQLAGFFVLASTIMWIEKASNGAISRSAKHLDAYKAVLTVVIVFVIPWVVLGWRSVRREQRRLFWVFFAISLVFLVTSSACFGSDLFRFIFSIWPLFATTTITSYLLIVAINVMGIICRCRFGKGLKEFLQQTETPEGADFAPVYISQFPPPSPDDDEKGTMDFSDNTFRTIDFLLAPPPRSHQDSTPRPAKQQDTWRNYERSIPSYSEKSFYDYNSQHDEVTVAKGDSKTTVRMSVFNDPTRDTVKLSTTPSLAQGDFVLSGVREPSKLSKPKRKESVKKMVIGLPSNPRKGGNPIERSGGGFF